MDRRIAVTVVCHTAGIAAALAGMLPDDEVVPIWDPGEAALSGFDTWVVLATPAERALAARVAGLEVLSVPGTVFGAFHPDLVHVVHPDGGWVRSAVGDYNSAIVLWGWRRGLSVEEIAARFTPSTFAGLGYFDRWTPAVEGLRARFAESDLDFDTWFLPVRRTGAFMLGDNHPRLTALVQLARLVASRLGAEPDRVGFPWEDLLPDVLLATGPVWPVYPGVAEHLGVPGGLVWKAPDGALLGLRPFVAASLAAYAGLDPARVEVPVLDHPAFDEVLGPGPAR